MAVRSRSNTCNFVAQVISSRFTMDSASVCWWLVSNKLWTLNQPCHGSCVPFSAVFTARKSQPSLATDPPVGVICNCFTRNRIMSAWKEMDNKIISCHIMTMSYVSRPMLMVQSIFTRALGLRPISLEKPDRAMIWTYQKRTKTESLHRRGRRHRFPRCHTSIQTSPDQVQPGFWDYGVINITKIWSGGLIHVFPGFFMFNPTNCDKNIEKQMTNGNQIWYDHQIGKLPHGYL